MTQTALGLVVIVGLLAMIFLAFIAAKAGGRGVGPARRGRDQDAASIVVLGGAFSGGSSDCGASDGGGGASDGGGGSCDGGGGGA